MKSKDKKCDNDVDCKANDSDSGSCLTNGPSVGGRAEREGGVVGALDRDASH